MKGFTYLALAFVATAQRKTTDPIYSCEEGELVGKQCVTKNIMPATKYCQQGTLMGDFCQQPVKRNESCPEGTQPRGNTCVIRDVVPVERNCPLNSHDIGGECHQYSVTGIVEVCERGKLVGGQCEFTEIVAPTVQKACPIGYTEEPGKAGCWKRDSMDCSPPYVGKRQLQQMGGDINGNSMYAHGQTKLAITSKMCDIKLEAPLYVTKECPMAYEMVNGRECLRKSFEPSNLECSLGENHLCFPTNVVPGNMRCPSGYQKEGEQCVTYNPVPKNIFCPQGTIQTATGQCAQASPALLKCQAGATLEGDQCISTTTKQPKVQVTVTCTGKNCYN